jgi:uncharacterized protein YndB with AHSA1/START domain
MGARDDGGGRLVPARRLRETFRVDARRWYDASCADVFAAWVDPALVRRWLFATASRPFARAVVEARRGGALRLVTADGVAAVTGRVEDLLAPARLHLALDHDAHRTSVLATLHPAHGGTTLHVRHDGIAPHRADWLDGRWSGMLYGLGEALDCDSHEMSHDLELR